MNTHILICHCMYSYDSFTEQTLHMSAYEVRSKKGSETLPVATERNVVRSYVQVCICDFMQSANKSGKIRESSNEDR